MHVLETSWKPRGCTVDTHTHTDTYTHEELYTLFRQKVCSKFQFLNLELSFEHYTLLFINE